MSHSAGSLAGRPPSTAISSSAISVPIDASSPAEPSARTAAEQERCPGTLRVPGTTWLNPGDHTVIGRDQPAADVERRGRGDPATLDERQLGGAPADIDVQQAKSVLVLVESAHEVIAGSHDTEHFVYRGDALGAVQHTGFEHIFFG